MVAVIAASERDRIRERTQDGVREMVQPMPAEDRDRVLKLLRVRVDVEASDDCGGCAGRGKLPGRRGGYRCDHCKGRRQIATVHVQGVFRRQAWATCWRAAPFVISVTNAVRPHGAEP